MAGFWYKNENDRVPVGFGAGDGVDSIQAPVMLVIILEVEYTPFDA